ncbi:MAG: hypothetical protein KC457_30510, partial [Myxococcales bacterium]|nr:hypothetical protein [Myxococcales bacterium]
QAMLQLHQKVRDRIQQLLDHARIEAGKSLLPASSASLDGGGLQDVLPPWLRRRLLAEPTP